MRIIDLQSFLLRPSPPRGGWKVSKHLLLVRVDTDEGIVGWGEAFTLGDREQNIAQNVTNLRRYLVGKNPFHIREFTRWARDIFSEGRPALELFCAMSGI